MVTKAINENWENYLKNQAKLYPALRYMMTSEFKTSVMHPIIETIKNNSRDIYRGLIKVRLATGTYKLQSKRRAINKTMTDATCLLCKTTAETREHFLLHCSKLQGKRVQCMTTCPITKPNDVQNMLQLILDSTDISLQECLGSTTTEEIEFWCRNLCYSLHAERSRLIAELSSSKQ
jgi:hypothetical protein